MTVMTEWDKVLVTAISLVVVLVVFLNYLILPMQKKADELDAAIETAQQQKEEMVEKINSLPALQQTFDALTVNFLHAAEEYYPIMTSQEVDREITNMVLQCGLESVDLKITIPSDPSPLEAFYASSLARTGTPYEETEATRPGAGSEAEFAAAEAAAEARASGQETEAPSAPVGTNGNTEIYAAKVTITAEGSDSAFQTLIDKVTNGYPAIRVDGYSYQTKLGTVSYDAEGNLISTGTVRYLTLDLELYMCDKTFERE